MIHTRVVTALLLVASVASAATGTPFYAADLRDTRFQFHSPAAFGVIEEHGLWLHFPNGHVHWGVEGATPWQLHPDGPSTGTFALGSSDVERPVYAALAAREVLEGVELRFRRTADGLESSFVLAPGKVSLPLFYEGADRLSVNAGSVLVQSRFAEIREEGLRCSQGEAVVPCHFEALPRTDTRLRYRIVVEPLYPAQPVLVDPHVVWSVPGGGSKDEHRPLLTGIGDPPSQYLFVFSETMSPSSSLSGAQTSGTPSSVGTHVLMTRQNSNLQSGPSYRLVGGDGNDVPHAVTSRGTGLCLGGTSTSSAGSLAATAKVMIGPAGSAGSGENAFVMCFSTGGILDELVLFGGSQDDELWALTFDAAGDLWLGGQTDSSSDFPSCTGGSCNAQAGRSNAFIAHLRVVAPAVLDEAKMYPVSSMDSRVSSLVFSNGRVFAARQKIVTGASTGFEIVERSQVGVLSSLISVAAPSGFVTGPSGVEPVLLAGATDTGLYVASNQTGAVSWPGELLNAPVGDPSGFVGRVDVTATGMNAGWGSYVSGTSTTLIRGLSVDRHGEPLLTGAGQGLPPLRTEDDSVSVPSQKMFIQHSSSDGGLRYRFVFGGAQGNDVAWGSWQPVNQPTQPIVLSYFSAELEGKDDGYPGFGGTVHVHVGDAGTEYLLGSWSMDESPPLLTLNADAGLSYGALPSMTFSATEGSVTDSTLDELRATLECPGSPQEFARKFDAGSTLSWPNTQLSCPSSAPGYYRGAVWVVNTDGFDVSKEVLITVREQDGGLPPVVVDAGSPTDGGMDAGTDAGLDAGGEQLTDAGTDGGEMELDDGGEEVGIDQDSGTVLRRQRSPAGCSCDTTDVGAMALLAMMVTIGRSRRAQR